MKIVRRPGAGSVPSVAQLSAMAACLLFGLALAKVWQAGLTTAAVLMVVSGALLVVSNTARLIPRHRVSLWWLGLAQGVYGRDRLGWDATCDGPRPRDLRARVAGWMLLRKTF